MFPLEFPSYTYVPGQVPHPISDSQGHMFNQDSRLRMLSESEALQYGKHLFNHGFYWEAHEVWEQVWHMRGRNGPAADFVKGLIKLAAAGVKCLEANSIGVHRHARRAQALFLSLNSADFLQDFAQTDLLKICQILLDSPPVLQFASDGTPVVLNGLIIP